MSKTGTNCCLRMTFAGYNFDFDFDVDFDFDFDFKMLKQSQKIIIIWRAPGPYGTNPTQPFNAVKMLKSKTALILTLILKY